MTVSNASSTRTIRNERVKLTYLKWQKLYETEKPYQVFLNLKPGIPSTNLVFENDEYQEIIDVRGQQDRFNLDKNGFEYITHESKVKAFDNQDEIESVYLPETEEIIRKHVKNVDRLLVFDYRVSFWVLPFTWYTWLDRVTDGALNHGEWDRSGGMQTQAVSETS